MDEQPPKRVIRLSSPFRDPVGRAVFATIRGAIEKALAIDQINHTYFRAASKTDSRHFSEKVLEVLNVNWRVAEADLARIPKTGPLVVVANHPFGGIEGILLSALLHSVRPDVKLMANFLLEKLPAFRDSFIFVNPFGGESAKRANLKGVKDSIQWLRDGHALGVFPAGEVSHIRLLRGGVTDSEWAESIARLIRKTESPTLPLFFKGSNGLLFNLLGLVHPRLRTAMLPNELVNKRDKEIEIRIGNLIPFNKLSEFTKDRELMDYLRMRTYYLQNRPAPARKRRKFPLPARAPKTEQKPVAEAVPPELLERDIQALPVDCALVKQNDYLVVCARADQLPNVMREIGRLRELTFREADEGTGEPLDLDRFDEFYLHLLLWNSAKREVVGAYRLGPSDLILERFGKRGFYTSTLFRYRSRLLKQINPALEMGRSFIRKEYQRSFFPLMLLWRGIGSYVVSNPRYKILFGPVSISYDYHSSTRRLLVKFLKKHSFEPDLSRMVRPRAPLRPNPVAAWKARRAPMVADDLEDVESLIADVEARQKGVPILLRQYLKLGGKLVSFNVDSSFSNVLDGLILVDLSQSDPKALERYLGKEGVRSFMSFHGRTLPLV